MSELYRRIYSGKQNRAQGVMCVGWDEGAFIYETSEQRSTTGKTRKNDQVSNATRDEKRGRGCGDGTQGSGASGVTDETQTKNGNAISEMG